MNERHASFILLVLLLGFLSAGGCGNGSTSTVDDNDDRLVPNPNTDAPLVRILEVETEEPTRIRVEISEGDDAWTHEFPGFNNSHSLPVLGFSAGKEHTVLVQAIDQQGNLESENILTVQAEPLPEDFPELSVTANQELMEPGVTIFASGQYVIVVDNEGEVIWHYKIGLPFTLDRDIRRISNGNLLLLLPPGQIVEIDMRGNIVRGWHASRTTDGIEGSIPVDTNAFHHEAFEMENGNLLELSHELRVYEDYPAEVIQGSRLVTANVVGDVVVKFTRDGAIVNEWHMLDILDPYRLSYSSAVGFFDGFYQENFGIEPPTFDWSHGNGVIHDPRDDSIIVSFRHQDALIKLDRLTGQLKWILGSHANRDQQLFGEFLLQPIAPGDFFFPYRLHAPMVTDDGNILLFDNGNFRASPFDPPLEELIFSRAVEYSIIEEQKQVEIVWESTGFSEEDIFAPFMGDADRLPVTGNVLIAFGGRDPAEIIELSHTMPPVEVFRLSTPNLSPLSFIYRAGRLPLTRCHMGSSKKNKLELAGLLY